MQPALVVQSSHPQGCRAQEGQQTLSTRRGAGYCYERCQIQTTSVS